MTSLCRSGKLNFYSHSWTVELTCHGFSYISFFPMRAAWLCLIGDVHHAVLSEEKWYILGKEAESTSIRDLDVVMSTRRIYRSER